MKIDRNSIVTKLDACLAAKSSKKSSVFNDKNMERIAKAFIAVFKKQVSDMEVRSSKNYRRSLEDGKLGRTAVAAASNVKYGGYSVSTKGDVAYVDVNFYGDLHRDSLIPPASSGRRAGKGVDNIIALLNSGYYRRKAVYGYWKSHGRYTMSIPVRAGSNFVGKAVDEFMKSYAKQYGVREVIVSDTYKTDI